MIVRSVYTQELLALEVEFMMRVKGHSNIVAIHAVYADVESVYIVMEHMYVLHLLACSLRGCLT